MFDYKQIHIKKWKVIQIWAENALLQEHLINTMLVPEVQKIVIGGPIS
jgi:hypothetical protein